MVIYVYSDENTIPKYVGKAKCLKTRCKQHINQDRFIYDTWFYRWLNKEIREGRGFYVDVLEIVQDEGKWQEREVYWIKHLRDLGYEICNMTDGGDGNNNQVFSEETKRKKSEALKGHKVSKETRKKISDSHKGKKLKESTKQKIREFNLGKKCPQKFKDKFSKKVCQKDLKGNLIKIFPSLTEASNSIGVRKSTLSGVILKKKSHTFAGYMWEYYS